MTCVTDWKTALSTPKTDAESFSFFRKSGIDAVEISMRWDQYGNIDWPILQENARQAGLELWSLHLPFSTQINIAALEEDTRRNAVQTHLTLMEQASAIGITRFIVHPSAEPIPDELRPEWMKAACRSLVEMAAAAEKLGGVVCVENLPRTCLGHTAEEMLELIAADNRLRVCFDVNHLLTAYGTTHREFVEKLGSKIITTHMSDYDFEDEKHFFPGIGMLNWNEVITVLEEADYSGPFLFEGGFAPSSWMPHVPFGQIEEAHERHLNIKSFCGRSSL